MKPVAIILTATLFVIGLVIALFLYLVYVVGEMNPGGAAPRDSALLFVVAMPLVGVAYIAVPFLLEKLPDIGRLERNRSLTFAGILLILGPLWGAFLTLLLALFQAQCFLGGGELAHFLAYDPLYVRCEIPDPRAGELCGTVGSATCAYGCEAVNFDESRYEGHGEYNGTLEGRCMRHSPFSSCTAPSFMIKDGRVEFRPACN